MTLDRWTGACLVAGLLAIPLAAQPPADPQAMQQVDELPIVRIMVEASLDAAGKCTISTNPSSLSVKDGTRVAWHLVKKEGTTGCGRGARLVLRDTEFRRRNANGSTGADGSCPIIGADQPGSDDGHRHRRVRRGTMTGPVRCKYTVRLFQGNSEIAMEDPDLEILQ